MSTAGGCSARRTTPSWRPTPISKEYRRLTSCSRPMRASTAARSIRLRKGTRSSPTTWCATCARCSTSVRWWKTCRDRLSPRHQTAISAELFRRCLAVAAPLAERRQQISRRRSDRGAGRKDRCGAGALERLVVLPRHHPTDSNHDVAAAGLFEFGLELRHQREVGGCERGHTEDVHVVVDRLPGS